MNRARLFTFGAVIAATAVLAVLGYVSLRQWQASAELLFREQAREMATMARPGLPLRRVGVGC